MQIASASPIHLQKYGRDCKSQWNKATSFKHVSKAQATILFLCAGVSNAHCLEHNNDTGDLMTTTFLLNYRHAGRETAPAAILSCRQAFSMKVQDHSSHGRASF